MIPIIKNRVIEEKGQALVEMALVLFILLLLVFGIVEFGRILNAQVMVTNASREGARYAAVGGGDSEVETKIINLTSSLTSTPEEDVTVVITPSARNHGDEVEVMVQYNIPLVTPVFGWIMGTGGSDTFTVTGTTSMRVE